MEGPTTSGESPGLNSRRHVHDTVILWSSDKLEFEVDKQVACEFQFLIHMVQGRRFEDPPILLDRIHSTVLSPALIYCEYHVRSRKRREANCSSTEVILAAEKDWDREFVNSLDCNTLFRLLEISLEWKIDGLRELTLSTAVKQIYDSAHRGLEAETYAFMRSHLDSPRDA